MPEAAPANYSPPLTRWGHAWRMLVCLVLSGGAWGVQIDGQWNHHRAWFWIDLAGGIAAFALVAYRRRWPVQVGIATQLLGLVSASAGGPAALALVSLATRRRVPSIAVVGALGVVTGQLYGHWHPLRHDSPPWLNLTFTIAITIAISAMGMYIGSRRELVWTLRDRADQAESEQELRVDQARSAERERIAREMHDVLAHRISLVTMHAGALAYRTDLPPEQIRETAQLIQAKAHEALADLRQVLGVLRSPDGVGDRPQPTYGDLGVLIAEATDGGMVVEVDEDLPDGLQPPDQVGRTIFRVVQEALTNARKHAVGAHVYLRVSGDPDSGITVVIRNARRVGALGMPTTPGAGLGLVGLRERAELGGGTLTTVDDGQSFSLQCWLPWTQGPDA
ncbi:MAG: histidine kinase [Marmoricola sp.]|nr:histidine kinase [Marmoricola sp.]